MSLFISHGAPTLLLDATPAHRFLQTLGRALHRPRAIILISAHWETDELTVHTGEHPGLMHDFHGFPRALYETHWPARGEPRLAQDIVTRLKGLGMIVSTEHARGWDHGLWVPLALLYPQADVPVVQISLPRRDDAPALWQLGAWLNAWENEGYWVIGSGSLTHNLRQRSAQWNSPINPAIHPFRGALNAILASGDRRGLQHWEQLPDARLHHPTPEHFLPLLVAAANPGPARQLHDSVEYGNLAMDVWGFGAHAHAVPDAL